MKFSRRALLKGAIAFAATAVLAPTLASVGAVDADVRDEQVRAMRRRLDGVPDWRTLEPVLQVALGAAMWRLDRSKQWPPSDAAIRLAFEGRPAGGYWGRRRQRSGMLVRQAVRMEAMA